MLTRPRQAAQDIIAFNLPTQVLWMALALISITLSAMVSGLFHAVPIPDEATAQAVQSMMFYDAPLGFAVLNLGNAVLSIFILLWSGRLFGGTGGMPEILSVIVLLQATVVACLIAIASISLLVPVLAAFAFLLFALWIVWSMVSIIDVAHRFENIAKAAAVFLMATFVVPFGLSVVLGAVAAPFIGVK